MIKSFVAMYGLGFAKTITYMLQATEYNIGAYIKWLWRTNDFSHVTYRRQLVWTRVAKMIHRFVLAGMLLQYIGSAVWYISLLGEPYTWRSSVALTIFFLTPVVWMFLAVTPLLLGRWFIIAPLTHKAVKASRKTFAKHAGTRIAVAGSYGKTTMKEMLLTVLAEGKKVAATPANRNVARSHAQFAKQLKGDEEVLVVEFGEGAPGDVAKFTRTVQPDIGVITGLAPAHLDKYKTLEAAGRDIFHLAEKLGGQNIYVNKDSQAAKPFIKPGYQAYDASSAAGWKVSNVKSSISGLSFTLSKGKQKLNLKSSLIGRHQIGPLSAAAAIAVRLGLKPEQVEAGVAKIESFEHRMQPRQLAGAWIIDDTYNGNIDGMKAGLALLAELKAKRKIYITPGLVDQGAESAAIHQELGKTIAEAKPDIVVLMKHSVTNDIKLGLEKAGYKGRLIIEDDPLNFYNNLEQFVAAGDLVLMQNDWPDNYV